MMWLLFEFYLSTDIDNINFRCTDAVQDGQNFIVGKPGKKGQFRRTGRYFCIKALLVGIQTDNLPLVYYNKAANAKNTHNRRV